MVSSYSRSKLNSGAIIVASIADIYYSIKIGLSPLQESRQLVTCALW